MNGNIFKKRENILPYEYPQLLDYKDAIRHSYWIDTEYNFTEDISDFKTKITDEEKEVIKRTMLAIAQIEVKVKTFWGDCFKRMPIAEIGDVKGMAEHALMVLDDENLPRFKAAALARAKEFDQSIIVPQYEAFYNEVLEKGTV